MLSSLARNSQELRLQRIFEILWVLFEKIPLFYFNWPKSLIWGILGHVGDIFCKLHLLMLQNKFFGQKIFEYHTGVSKVPFYQNWKIAKMPLLSPCMKFKKSFGQKTSFETLWRWHLQEKLPTCPNVHQIQNLGKLK